MDTKYEERLSAVLREIEADFRKRVEESKANSGNSRKQFEKRIERDNSEESEDSGYDDGNIHSGEYNERGGSGEDDNEWTGECDEWSLEAE